MDRHETIVLVATCSLVASLLGTAVALRFHANENKQRAAALLHPPTVKELDKPLLKLEGKDDEHIMKEQVKKCIIAHKDFPKKGIMFQDFLPIFQSHEATRSMITLLFRHLRSNHGKIDVIVGLEARGFLLGPILAMYLDASFVPVRKVGKLPGQTEKISYSKEYGTDEIEIQKYAIKNGDRVVIIDDLLATGGSIVATAELVKKMGGIVTEAVVVVELTQLKGRDKFKGFPVWAMFEM
jgi:adenine phosphoribosyltransferase